MPSALHTHILELLGEKPAMVLSGKFVRALLLQRLQAAATAFGGQTIGTKHDLVVAQFEGLTSDGKPLEPSAIVAKLGSHIGGSLEVDVEPPFEFSIRLAYQGDLSKTFVRFVFTVPQLKFHLRGIGTALRFAMVPVEVRVSTLLDDIEREEALRASGIDADELLRVEGIFAYGTGDSLLNSVFGNLRDIDLVALFPTVTFGGELFVRATNTDDETGSAEALLVVPEFFSLSTLGTCSPHSAVEGAIVTTTKPRDAGATDGSRSWDFNALIENRPASLPAANTERPDAGLFLPRALLDQHFGSLTPAINYEESDSGFVGYTIRATASITGVQVMLQPGALRLNLRFKLWALGRLNIEVPCVGRQSFAELEARLPENGEADVSVDLRVALDSGARVLLLSEVVGLNLGKASVNLSLLGPLGRTLGANYWGYVADFIIGRVIQNNLPGMVFDAIRNTVDRHYFIVADLRKYLGFIGDVPNAPMYSQADSTVLIGLNHQASAVRRG